MPKKRPLTDDEVDHLKGHLSEGFSKLLVIKSVFSGYFKHDDEPRQIIESMLSSFGQLKRALEESHRRTGSDAP